MTNAFSASTERIMWFLSFFKFFYFYLLNFLNVLFLRDRERKSMREGGQREGETEPEVGFVSTEVHTGLELTD